MRDAGYFVFAFPNSPFPVSKGAVLDPAVEGTVCDITAEDIELDVENGAMPTGAAVAFVFTVVDALSKPVIEEPDTVVECFEVLGSGSLLVGAVELVSWTETSSEVRPASVSKMLRWVKGREPPYL